MSAPRRVYLSGKTWALRGEIRAAGGQWDQERKQWYVTPDKRAAMVALAAEAKIKASPRRRSTVPDDDQKVIGEAIYLKNKGQAWIAWMGPVKRTGFMTARLVSLDGRRLFWAPGKEIKVIRRFPTALPLAGLLTSPEGLTHEPPH